MSSKKTIIIDVLGSDNGIKSILLGASILLNEYDDLSLILVGPQNDILLECQNLKIDVKRIEIIDASHTIENTDNIVESFFDKTDSSLLRAIKELNENEDCIGLLSAGNSGALLLGSIKYLRLDEHTRPCLAAVLPTIKGEYFTLIDCGATIDADSKQLLNFALMGQEFMKKLYSLSSPRVALLSNGVEPTKGNKLVKETHLLLKEDKRINFVGNFEPFDAFLGGCDVLVSDGFIANEFLKTIEGMVKTIALDIQDFSKKEKTDLTKLSQYLIGKYDVSSLGGGIILGIKKPIIKCRGNANENTFVNSGKMLLNLYNHEDLYKK